ncbi:MAG: hypothetical protein ABJB76_03480 [Candidatus Nitrosocosmicus sp.]
MSNNITNSTEFSYNNTNNQNNSNDFKESVNKSLDASNNQILLYALDIESGNTKIVTIPL